MKQIRKIINLLLIIDEQTKGRLVSLLCLDEIENQIEALQSDTYGLAKVIKNGFTNNSWSEIRWNVSSIKSSVAKISELIGNLLGKKHFEIDQSCQEVQDDAKKGAKEDIIYLIEQSLVFIKKEFKKENILSLRECEIRRGEKEIREFKNILQQLDEYLNFVSVNVPSTRQEIKVFINVISLFLTQIECHLYFIVWITKFWVIICWMNVRFLQLHDE